MEESPCLAPTGAPVEILMRKGTGVVRCDERTNDRALMVFLLLLPVGSIEKFHVLML